MFDLIKQQNIKIELLQKNLTIINNKLTGAYLEIPKPLSKIEVVVPIAQPIVEPKPIQTPISIAQPSNQPRKNIRIFGHLQDEDGKNLSEASIRITDSSNQVIKNTKTNRGGQWTSFLPPGKYSVEIAAKGMQPGFRVVELFEGQSEVEVA